MFRKILVGVDESEHARRAVDMAINMAQSCDASVCLLHAFPHVADHLGFPTYDHMLETATMHGRELLDTFYNKLHPLVPLETQLIEGPPAAAILRVAQAEGFDLIIVGSRGNNSLVSLLMGSVSTSVTQRAPCPVMVTH